MVTIVGFGTHLSPLPNIIFCCLDRCRLQSGPSQKYRRFYRKDPDEYIGFYRNFPGKYRLNIGMPHTSHPKYHQNSLKLWMGKTQYCRKLINYSVQIIQIIRLIALALQHQTHTRMRFSTLVCWIN